MANFTPKTEIIILSIKEQQFLYQACKRLRENHMNWVNNSRLISGGIKAPKSWFGSLDN